MLCHRRILSGQPFIDAYEFNYSGVTFAANKQQAVVNSYNNNSSKSITQIAVLPRLPATKATRRQAKMNKFRWFNEKQPVFRHRVSPLLYAPPMAPHYSIALVLTSLILCGALALFTSLPFANCRSKAKHGCSSAAFNCWLRCLFVYLFWFAASLTLWLVVALFPFQLTFWALHFRTHLISD